MRITGLFFLLLFATACNYSKGFKKDLGTGLSASYNGFYINDAYLTIDDEKASSNVVPLGAKVSIIISGVSNYYVENGKVFPGCTIIVRDKQGKEMLNIPNAFNHLANGQPIEEAAMLKAIVTTGAPMVAGETYHLEALFYDVHKKENTVSTNVDIIMK